MQENDCAARELCKGQVITLKRYRPSLLRSVDMAICALIHLTQHGRTDTIDSAKFCDGRHNIYIFLLIYI